MNTLQECKEGKEENKLKKFIKPTILEISDYCFERNNKIDATHFFDYYEANGWMAGRVKMKDWKATVRTWEKNDYKKPHQNGQSPKPDKLSNAIEIFTTNDAILRERLRQEQENG